MMMMMMMRRERREGRRGAGGPGVWPWGCRSGRNHTTKYLLGNPTFLASRQILEVE